MKTIPAVELADSHFFGQICYSIYRVLFCSDNGHSADLQQKRLYTLYVLNFPQYCNLSMVIILFFCVMKLCYGCHPIDTLPN